MESSFSQHVLTSDLASYFNEAEIAELSVDDVDSNNMYLHDMAIEDATALTSYPSTRESSYNMSDMEGQLLAVYDSKLIKDILTELYQHRGLSAMQIISLNEKVNNFRLDYDLLSQLIGHEPSLIIIQVLYHL